ncbi:MAG: TMEM165/GDT1 family protein [Methyloprofundus sp.]|nr:TMEM165/GDT1 family protein [Methyloprofundus sp.]
MENLLQSLQHAYMSLSTLNFVDLSATASTSFLLIAAAEIGDKSQLVCMTLAARHRAAPVLFGAIASFAFLNSLAVVFGAAIASWFPAYMVSAVVALLFAAFGIHALLISEDEETEDVVEKTGHSLFFTTFLLITVAEFGDKTQLAVVALSSTALPIAVWLGSTSALILTSALGVIAGRTVLQQFPLTFLHKISGGIFLILALFAAYNTYLIY